MRKQLSIFLLFYCSLASAQTAMINPDLQDSVPGEGQKKDYISLEEVIITQKNNSNHGLILINKLDKQLRPVNTAQDLLRMVPGLFIAQHAGGGKAEQIFLRGFDSDHGTDFSVSIDGIPVNMVSHAHGQGYADFHFVIPELVDALHVYKGPYHTRFGNFATSGAGEFTTRNSIDAGTIKMEYGMFDNYRAMGMADVLKGKHLFSKYKESMIVAGEYVFFNSYLKSPQDYKRYNLFWKYNGRLTERTSLTLMGSTFGADWDASGQIPERAVTEGVIERYGSIDDSEGGATSRTNAFATLSSSLTNGGMLKNQVYYSHYKFDLYSNFTFFLRDSINGDQIAQTEEGRNIYGYTGSYENYRLLGKKELRTRFGIGTRIDEGNISLKNAVKRVVTDTTVAGHLFEQNLNTWVDETLHLTEKFSVNVGLRVDYFIFGFTNFTDASLSEKKGRHRVSPKLNFNYDLSPSVQLFFRNGIGFHSNDARSVVSGESGNALPRAYGSEIGSTFKAGKKMIVNAVLWALDMENELVYVGDEGVTEESGATRRLGADLSVRWQLHKNVFADLDLNYSYARYKDLPQGENYVPLAPALTSIGGITLKRDNGFSGSLRYRYIDSRPANETNTVTARGYFLLDAVVNYQWKNLQLGITAQNLLNSEWNEAQFDTESRLKHETMPVNELHFTPGSPFFVKGSVSYNF